MRRRIFILAALLVGCSRAYYEVGMHREDVYDAVERLEIRALVAEARLDERHDLLVAPQSGSVFRGDHNALSDRQSFGRFRPTDSSLEQRSRWLEAVGSVELWYAVLMRDLEVTEILEDEDRERLLDRVGYWMQDNVDPEFDVELLDEIRLQAEESE